MRKIKPIKVRVKRVTLAAGEVARIINSSGRVRFAVKGTVSVPENHSLFVGGPGEFGDYARQGIDHE